MDESIRPRPIIIYRHSPDMGEITGYGGELEEAAQDMFEAGVKFVMENHIPADQLSVLSLDSVFGIFFPRTQRAKELQAVMIKASATVTTSAIMHLLLLRCSAVARDGWEEYCHQVRKHEQERLSTKYG